MDHTLLPQGLHAWLHDQNWQVVDITPIVGGYAATLFHLNLLDDTGESRSAVYKMFAQDRNKEAIWYRDVFTHAPELVPEVYGYVEHDGEQGMVLEDCGVPLKSMTASMNTEERSHLWHRALLWLADMHLRYEHRLPELISAGLISTYPVESSETWARFATDQLSQLADQKERASLITKEEVEALVSMSDWFYPRYSGWLNGRVTLTHGDPHHGNLLVSGANFRLIDWEATCAAIPQRDLAIFLQDVLDEKQHQALQTAYFRHLEASGWDVNRSDFQEAFQAVYFDNTLMMLGWEVYQYFKGHVSRSEIEQVVSIKLSWLKQAYSQLR